MSKLLLVDYSNLLHRSSHVHANLSHKKQFTGGVFGFISALTKVIYRYEFDRIIVCCDSKPYLRNAYYTEYKGNRKKRDQHEIRKLNDSFRLINAFLKVAGIPVLSVKGLEADDLIAYCVNSFSEDYGAVHIYSNDSDLYQLFSVCSDLMFHKVKRIYSYRDYLEEFPEIPPAEQPHLVAFMGSHNGVSGIKGVGPVTATKLISNFPMSRDLEDLFSEYEEGKYHSILARNLVLSKLPWPFFDYTTIVIPRKKRVIEKEVVRFFKSVNIKLTAKMSEAFIDG